MRDTITASKAALAEKKLDKIISRLESANTIGERERAGMAADLSGIRQVLRSQRQIIGKIEVGHE